MNNIKQALESAIKAMLSMEATIARNLGVSISDDEANAVLECKAALAELDKCEPVVLERDYNFMRDLAVGCEDAWNKLQKQEPVAWTKQSELDKTTTLTNPIVMWKNKYRSIENNIPLYTVPPQQQWVGLRDDEIDKMWEFYRGGWYDFAMAIEAKLKELNTKG